MQPSSLTGKQMCSHTGQQGTHATLTVTECHSREMTGVDDMTSPGCPGYVALFSHVCKWALPLLPSYNTVG